MEKKAKWMYIGDTDEWFTKGKIYLTIDRQHTEWKDLTEEELKNLSEEDYPEYERLEDGYLIFVDDEGDHIVVDKRVWQKDFYRL